MASLCLKSLRRPQMVLGLSQIRPNIGVQGTLTLISGKRYHFDHHAARTQRRPVLDATAPDHIPRLSLVPVKEPKPGGWKPTLVHSSGQVKFTVIRVPPGGEVPAHLHTESWDYFIPLRGSGLVETMSKDGKRSVFELNQDSFLALPPGDTHRVRNASLEGNDEFVFLIAQSPKDQYDFVGAENP